MSEAVPQIPPGTAALGTVAVDERTRRVGEVMGFVGPYVQLRPLGGGREWDAVPAAVRPATAEERLHAALTAANARSSRTTLSPAPPAATPPRPPPDR